ncbi:tyrosine phosphatase family-domain-containing protein [Aspergillus varians]
MSYPLTKKNTNSVNESHQGWFFSVNAIYHVLSPTAVVNIAEKQGTGGVSPGSEESDAGKPQLPENFGEIATEIYRSSFPRPCHLPALKALGLRTIITLVEEPYTPSYESFLKENGIKHHRIHFIANKNATVKTPECVVDTILSIMLNKSNHPILIHCNKGKHRTGCVTGCFRKLQGWNEQDINDEYLRYSRPKQRPLDEAFIEAFDPSRLLHLAQVAGAKTWEPSGKYANIQCEEDQNTPNNLLQLPCNGMPMS